MKALLSIFLFIVCFNAKGQFYLLNQTQSAPPPTGCYSYTKPLDGLSPTIAYGLRQLRTAYTGAACRVRRASDNAEMDIGFDACGNLDTVILKTFAGVSAMYLKTLYDQSGNAIHATQTTTTKQPVIQLAQKNSRPVIWTNQSGIQENTMDFTTSLLGGTNPDVFLSANVTGTINTFGWAVFGAAANVATNNNAFRANNGASYNAFYKEGTGIPTFNTANNVWRIYNWYHVTATNTKTFAANNTAYTTVQTPATTPTGSIAYRLFGIGYNASFNREWNLLGYVAEVVVFANEQTTTVRDSYKSNVNAYYNIY